MSELTNYDLLDKSQLFHNLKKKKNEKDSFISPFLVHCTQWKW